MNRPAVGPPDGVPVARARRNTELGLVVLGLLVTATAYVLGSLGRTASLPANIVPFLVAVAGLLLAAHLATRRLAPGADPLLLPVAALLNGVGYVMIARLDSDLAALQATWTLVGVGAFVATLALLPRIRDLERYTWTLGAGGLVLLLLPLLPGLGRTINGSRLWVRIGPVSVQPGEFAKVALAAFLASYLVARREVLARGGRKVGPFVLPRVRDLGPVLVAWGASILVMVAQRDLGSSLLFFTLFVVLIWLATERATWLAIGLGMFAAASVLAWRTFSHVQRRVDVWLDPWAQPLDAGFQIVQATYALAWGGLTGTGIGRGDPDRVPLAHNDFIFSTIGEELGLAGATAVLAAFLLLIGSGLRTAIRTDRPFEKLLAAGLTTILGVQGFVIVAGVTRVLPLTGVTLPFVSYGGSSLVANYVLLALLVRMSDDAAQRLGEVPRRAATSLFVRRRAPVVEAAPGPDGRVAGATLLDDHDGAS